MAGLADLAVAVPGRRAPTSCCSGPTSSVDGDEVWQRPARPLGAGAQLLVVAPPRGLPAGHRRHARRERPPSSTALTEILHEPNHSRAATRSASRKETDDRPSRSTSTAPGRVEVATGLPFFDHMLEPARPSRRLRPRRCRPTATSRSTPTTPSRTSASSWARRFARRWATRPGSAASPRSGCPSTRRWSRSSLDLSGRPFLALRDRPARARRSSATRRSTRSWSRSSGGPSSPPPGITLHLVLVRGQEHPPHHRGLVQGRGPGPARRGAGRRSAAVPSTKGTL